MCASVTIDGWLCKSQPGHRSEAGVNMFIAFECWFCVIKLKPVPEDCKIQSFTICISNRWGWGGVGLLYNVMFHHFQKKKFGKDSVSVLFWVKMEEDTLLNGILHHCIVMPNLCLWLTCWQNLRKPTSNVPGPVLSRTLSRAKIRNWTYLSVHSHFLSTPSNVAAPPHNLTQISCATSRNWLWSWMGKGTPVMLINLMNDSLAWEQRGKAFGLSAYFYFTLTNRKDFYSLDSHTRRCYCNI